MVEQRTHKPLVGSSNLLPGTNLKACKSAKTKGLQALLFSRIALRGGKICFNTGNSEKSPLCLVCMSYANFGIMFRICLSTGKNFSDKSNGVWHILGRLREAAKTAE